MSLLFLFRREAMSHAIRFSRRQCGLVLSGCWHYIQLVSF